MKLIYAGIAGQPTTNWGNYLFNCTRNKQCQRQFFVPIKSLADLQFYVDLPGKPLTYEATIMDLCSPDCTSSLGDFNSDFNNDYFIGSDCVPGENHVVFNNYVVAQKPNKTWYGVFGGLTGSGYKSFFVRFTFSVNGLSYVYYSQMFTLEDCSPLAYLRGCYPNEAPPADATDCNGIYYGLPATSDVLGMANYRYFHWAYIRYGQVIEHSKKIKFAFFNSQRTYKAEVTKGWLLDFELVPAFYAETLLGIFTRGNVQIDGVEYKLAEDQSWQVVDIDSKLWDMNTNLDQLCRQYFGCGPSDCALPDLPGGGSGAPSTIGSGPGTLTCKTYQITNQDPEVILNIHFTDCNGQTGTMELQPNTISDQFCAYAETIAFSGTTNYQVTIISEDGCNIEPLCEEYYNDGNSAQTGIQYTDCGGNQYFNVTVNPGESICIEPGSASGGGFGYLRYLGHCQSSPKCWTYDILAQDGGCLLWWQDCGSGMLMSSFVNGAITVCSRIIPYASQGGFTMTGGTSPCYP